MTDENNDGKGTEVPHELLEFVNDEHVRESLPIRFYFSDKEFILEIMLFFDLSDPSNFDTEHNYLRFARNGEGDVLLVDLNGDSLEIMQEEFLLQEEFADIDYIDLTLDDLCKAKWVSI